MRRAPIKRAASVAHACATASHAGLDPQLDLALLLELPGGAAASRCFEADLTVEASVGKDSLAESARRLLGSPRVYRLVFDGVAEMGSLLLRP